ncbi:hydrogenase formation protein HypD [Chromobacterium amazonense]|uniref:Hydrogenase maturation factor n=1 Tax=Chromobacterium amazonense TaxID=1382803 RepID=A0A2S9X4R0_9NEIS|nr:hydrogenase formation protein HypD [Chromobacterium amazonense]PRP70719.1 hydrogenase formation protein HypD [Chromobacterium amazonense]
MKYIEAFRDGALARKLAATIQAEADPARQYRLMEFCGGHTHAIARYGLPDLLPANIRLIHGPGCPVCVLPTGRIDSAIALAGEPGLILCTYADTLRVPASGGLSLLKARAAGADVRMVYSCDDALAIAQAHPDRQVVFFAIGFETTTPPTAAVILRAQKLGLANFSVFCNHVLTPAAMVHIMESQGDPDAVALDGFIGPAHVSTVIGYGAYEGFAAQYCRPVVISGFEPLDVMQSILMLLRQLNDGRAEVENQFSRVVSREGNRKAQALCEQVFELRDEYDWRGLGTVPLSALRIRPDYAAFDAERRFALPYRQVPDHKACECAAILRGHKQPADCRAFGTACTPERPLGACMVSSEGACAAHFTYGRFRAADKNGDAA